jgi:hypothetical protein
VLGTLLFLLPAGAQDRRIAIYDFNSQNADVNVRGKVPPTLNLGHQAAGLIMTIPDTDKRKQIRRMTLSFPPMSVTEAK